jgi:CRISPR-associated protein Cmr2
MSYLLAISIGPVQDFIAAGRKTRDLWFGSFLLSEVSREIASAVRQPGVEMIFPDEAAVDAGLPVANKILAWVDSGIDPRVLAAEARSRAATHLAGKVQVLDSLPEPVRRHVRKSLLKKQLAEFLEFAAAWYPVDDGTYQQSRREVELLLAGRKALRDFAPAHGLDGVPKSSLDPARESVIDWPDDPQFAERVRRRLRLKGAEQLDGVSLVKRLDEPRRFVSVSRVALDPFIRRAHKQRPVALKELADRAAAMAAAVHPSVESFRDKLDNGLEQYQPFPFDSQLFYDDGRGDPDLGETDSPHRQSAREFSLAADALRDSLMIPELPAYFAVLVAAADAIVRDCQGAMVYSGGDDVLAFLPLDRALVCADRLRLAFADSMQGVSGETTVSLSVGVAIGHYGEHLQRLLAWGREAERAAKAPRDPRRPLETARNALAVSFHTRGAGAGRTVVHSWSEHPVARRWNRWVAWHRCDVMPDSAAYELTRIEEEFRRLWLDAATEDRRRRLTRLLPLEVIRVLERRRAQRGAAAFSPARRRVLASLVGDDLDALRRLADELIIARQIASVTDVAEGKPESGFRNLLAGLRQGDGHGHKEGPGDDVQRDR